MKNRTVIGIICMVVAIAITFIVAPIVTRLTDGTTEVVRLTENVKRGTEIKAEMLETVKVKADALPDGFIDDGAKAIGKYATSNLYKGDYLTGEKLAGEANSAEDVFESLDGSKLAFSVTIANFASGLSGKLENGDIVSLVVVDDDTQRSIIPGALTYVRVITTTTVGGVDQDNVVKNDDGTYETPETITLLVNTAQAKLLAEYEETSTVHAALVYRGDAKTANKFLEAQEQYFIDLAEEEEENTESEETDDSGSGDDIIKKANDIINGRADYYDVEEAIGNE